MNKKLKIIALLVIIAITLPSLAFASDGNQNAGLVNNVVNLEGQSKMTVYDMMLFPTKQGNQLVFKADIYNAANSELSFMYYWLRVVTKQGTKHDVHLVNSSQGTSIPPKSSKTYIFTSTVDDDIKLSDINLQVIRWNFAVDGYEQHMGTVSITESYDPAVTWEQGKSVIIDNSPVQFKGSKFLLLKKGNEYEVKIDLITKNLGKFNVSIPNYTFYVQTAEGYLYPAKPAKSDHNVLPSVEEVLSLQAKIPTGINMNEMRLIMVETIGQYDVPQLTMKLPSESSTIEEEEQVYDEYMYETEDGTYLIQLRNIQRLPNNETDIISVEIEVSNVSGEKPLPNIKLVGSMELDGIDLEPDEIEGVRLDNNLNIKVGEAVTFIFNAEIPYSFEFEDIKFQLSEKIMDGTVEIATFVSEYGSLSIYESTIITTSTIGKRSTIELLSSDRYSTGTEDILYADVVMTNIEPRFINLEQLVAFFKLNDYVYFPAEIPDNKVLTMPSGTALIPITTKVPAGFKVDKIEVILGTQLKDQNSYKQAYLMKLPEIDTTVSEELTNIKIGNSVISLDNTKLYINGGAAALQFDYVLTKDSYQHELAEHKMRIAIVAGEKRFTQDVILGKDIKVGEKKEHRVSISGVDIQTEIQKHGYYIEILDVFDDGEKLKAYTEKEYSWYSDVPPIPTI